LRFFKKERTGDLVLEKLNWKTLRLASREERPMMKSSFGVREGKERTWR
jgi:hypothetical protein